jgi:hypothetical protein
MSDDALQAALTAMELREAELLAWGVVGAQWSEAEVVDILRKFGNGAELLRALEDMALMVRTPSGGLRSRAAETMRLLATLRQSWRGQKVEDGTPLITDFRFLHRPRRRPRRDLPAAEVRQRLSGGLRDTALAVFDILAPEEFSSFQERSTQVILDALGKDRAAGVMVTAGTGSGKTLAFYLPLILWLASSPGRPRGTAGLALYPRNELLKDQLRSLLGYVIRMEKADPAEPQLSLATWFGPTPQNRYWIEQGWAEGWTQTRGGGYLCPFLQCLDCGSGVEWPREDFRADRERLRCTSSTCGAEIDGRFLRLTRESARNHPADIMLSTTESLNRQLSAPHSLRAFGINPATLRVVLLDEVHTYDGTTGAQNAYLMRRLQHVVNRRLVWAGLSATLTNADEFFAQLTNLPVADVQFVAPHAEELEESGAEYLVALRHDPYSRTGTLSASIQALMAMARCLDTLAPDPFDPPPSAGMIAGKRLFAFSDKLDTTNRLYWDLLDAEGWDWPGRPKQVTPLTLAHLRAAGQDRVKPPVRSDRLSRDTLGQWWWLPQLLGHGVDGDVQLSIGRTSSQDRGVASDSQVVVATATLEVGFDDDRVGAVLQHKAPRDAAQFLQRKGRAGRKAETRPWTVVVLSDWGRDREAWAAYDALFDPVLPPRNLPLENLYVIRIQSVYAMLDWLAKELDYGPRESTWTDLAGPADQLGKRFEAVADARRRQQRVVNLLDKVLREGPERDRLRRHLRRALALPSGTAGEDILNAVLWEAPRPLLLSVIPTIHRRLRDQWRGEVPASGDESVRTRTPLRQFVPGNLFDELLVPDVEFEVPTRSGSYDVEHLPARRAIAEFSPGNVTRHFGVWAANKRHWIPLPDRVDSSGTHLIDVQDTYNAVEIDLVGDDQGDTALLTPTRVRLAAVPPDVKDASTIQPEWRFHYVLLGAGLKLSTNQSIARYLARLAAHLHANGEGVRVIRYARGGSGTVWAPDRRHVRVEFGTNQDGDWKPAALGFDINCDALAGSVVMPETWGPPEARERSEWLRHALLTTNDMREDLSIFERQTLFDVALLAHVTALLQGSPPADASSVGVGLVAAARRLGVLDMGHHGGDAKGLESWISDRSVHEAVLTLLNQATAPGRSDAWAAWVRRRFTLSMGHLVLAALARRCPGVDPEDLSVDVDEDDDATFVISENSPGGTGQVESFARAMLEDPEGFVGSLADVLRPSDIESLDEQLSAVALTEDRSFLTALEELRLSWTGGHEAVRKAVNTLEIQARTTGLFLSRASRTALSTRLLGPGAHPQLLSTVADWLRLRDRVRALGGLEISGRTLGGLLADRGELDEVLHLTDPSLRRRGEAVANVLWSWGSMSADIAGRPGADGLTATWDLLRRHVDLSATVVTVSEWSPAVRSIVHDVLVREAVATLRAPFDRARLIRRAILDLQTVPIEVGVLFCHPLVTGLAMGPGCVEVRLVLREAL